MSQIVARKVAQQAIHEGLAEISETDLEKELAANTWEPVYEAYEPSKAELVFS